MKLKEEELKDFHDIVNEYQNVFNELTIIENQLNLLYSKQSKLKEALEKNRNKEKMFTDNIIENYGKGKFNLETLEYELT
jgi:anaerobic ribonucleoside-triphosphate reductase